MNGGCRRTVVGYWSWRDSTHGSKAATHCRSVSMLPSARVCGRNANELRASLETDDAQADPMTLSGKADTAGGMSETIRPARCAGGVATACTQGKRAQHGRP